MATTPKHAVGAADVAVTTSSGTAVAAAAFLYEDYTSQRLTGRPKGDGWTAGGYFGWRFLPGLRLDLGLAHSLVSFDGKAGTAAGAFSGARWLGTLGLTGTYKLDQFILEPSARVYTLFEHENAYVDSLGTRQDARNFSTGRASTGAKLAYNWAQFDGVNLSPYVGLYGDMAINWASGPSLLFGTELGGLGSSQFLTLSGRGRLSVPF